MSWSKRRLTILGRILIIKTFAISKLVYLMQTLTLSEKSYKLFNRVVFKYLWNRNLNAARAPERLKRSIMYTPVNHGGFGMVDIKALGDSLDLRSYGRLVTTNHPFLSQLRPLVNHDDFFNVSINGNVDSKLKRSLALLNLDRMKLLRWSSEELLSNVNFRQMLSGLRLSSLLNRNGLQSLAFFAIHQHTPRPKVDQLTLGEFQGVSRFLKYPALREVINDLISHPVNAINVQRQIPDNDLFPLKQKSMVKLSMLSSKQLRLNNVELEDSLICIYKIGMILDPGEVLSWTRRLKKLTSTRHRNIILRVAHGDIFSNERLARFGLRQDPNCPNCNAQIESVEHKIIECPGAVEAWLELERIKVILGLNNLSVLSMENILGAKDRLNPLELTLQAELVHKLTAINVKYCPKVLVKKVIKYISYSERLTTEQREKFEEVLRD